MEGARLLPTISVVLPVLNEEDFILGTLTMLLAQSYPTELLQILVVDGGSTDATIERVQRCMTDHPGRIQLIPNPYGVSSSARNIGITNASGDFVLFVDAHVHITSTHVICQMAKCAVRNGALVLGRPQPLDPPGISPLQLSIAAVRSSLLGHSIESHIYKEKEEGWVSPFSIGAMYHRSLFERFGVFDESFDAAEDLEFNYRLERAGIKAFISPRFTIRYYPRRSLRGLFQQMTRYGLGRFRLFRKHPKRSRLEIFLPCLVVLAMVAAPVLVISVSQWYFMALWLSTAFTLLIMILALPVAARGGLLSIILAPVCFCVIHWGLAYGFVQGACIEGRQKLLRRDVSEQRG